MTQKQIFNLPIAAGQYTEQSERGAMGRWYRMDKVRFRKGLAEKIGGWVRTSDAEFIGICRGLKDWSSLDLLRWTVIATDTKLYVKEGENRYDITPLRAEGSLGAGPFTTFTGETRVRVTHTNHGCQVGDYVSFAGATVGGASGITVNGEYRVQTYIDPDNYEISDDETATTGSGGEGGSNVTYEYQIPAGARTVSAATGYGSGPYGREGYGNARTGSTLVLGIRTWSLDTWGEDLLACPSGGKIYWWDRSKGTGTRAQPLGGEAPQTNEAMIVSQRDRHVIALGAYDYFNQKFDPLLIRWCSTEDLNDWIPTSTNTSGDLRLYSGSKIVTGVRSRLETVIFTDVSVHTLPFVGGFDVFGLNIVGENVSILGPKAAIPIDHRVLFMGESDFFIYDGIVKVLPCDVRNFVYDNINTDQREKVYAGLNREFNEVWWFYPAYDESAWVQSAFDVSGPRGYALADASTSTSPVIFQSDGETTNGATTITEQSPYLNTVNATGLADIDNTRAKFGSTSFHTGAFEGEWEAADIAAYSIGSQDFVMEAWINFRQIVNTGGDEWSVVNQMGPGGDAFALNLERQGFNGTELITNFRIDQAENKVTMTGASQAASATPPGTWHHIVVERIGNTVYVGYNGVVYGSFAYSGSIPESTEPLRIGGNAETGLPGGQSNWNGYWWLDDVRIAVGTSYYNLDQGGTYTVPTSTLPSAGNNIGNIGYSYAFNSLGWTEAISTLAGTYQHDYILQNCEPLLTPTVGEYAVELGLSAASTVPAGITFLRQNLIGTPNTVEDDAKMWVVELDQANDNIQILRALATGGLAAPDNLGGGTHVVDFNTLTGASIAFGADPVSQRATTKYKLTVQVDTPQITVWVATNEGPNIQAFQFDMSAGEIAEFLGESCMALHVRPSASNSNWQFTNLAAGNVGIISSSDFDISPIEVNRYVMFNYEEGTWATGKMARTAWADRSPLYETAYATGPTADGTNSLLYLHETGTDDNGAAMTAFIESFDMEIPEAGEELMHVDQLIPDFLTLEGSVDVELTGRKYPLAGRITKGPYTVTPTTRKLSTRMRARQVAIKVTSSDTGDRWRMGHWRGRAGPHGKRG